MSHILQAVTDRAGGFIPLAVGTITLPATGVLLYRYLRRSKPESDEEKVTRAKRTEDRLTLAVASTAAYLSSTGLRKFGRNVMGLHGSHEAWMPSSDLLPFIALDIAALVCGKRARRRSKAADGPGLSGLFMWLLIFTSAGFSAAEAEDTIGRCARFAWPLIAGVLFEIGSLEERRDKRRQLKDRVVDWFDRRVPLRRLLQPVEWFQVQLALAADPDLTQAKATSRVRVTRAGRRLHRLGTVEDVRKAHPRITAFVSLLPGAAVLRVEGRTQRALRPLTETEVIEATALAQRLRETKQLAKTKTARQARKILDDIRVTTEATAGSTAWGTLVQPGTGQLGVGTGTGTANLVSASHTPPAPGTPNTSGTPVPDSVPVPEAVPASEYHMPGTDSAGTGTTAGTGKQVPETGTTHLVPTPGTGSQAGTAPGTEVPVQVVSLIKSSLPSPGTSAGSAPVEPGTAPLPKPQGAARQPGTSMTEQEKDEVVHALRRYLTDDGANFDLDKLNAGYSERITTQRDAVRRHFGIGTRNANALMRRAREDGLLRDHEPSVETEPDAQQEHDAGGLLDFDRAFALNAPAIGELVLAGPAAHTEP